MNTHQDRSIVSLAFSTLYGIMHFLDYFLTKIMSRMFLIMNVTRQIEKVVPMFVNYEQVE